MPLYDLQKIPYPHKKPGQKPVVVSTVFSSPFRIVEYVPISCFLIAFLFII